MGPVGERGPGERQSLQGGRGRAEPRHRDEPAEAPAPGTEPVPSEARERAFGDAARCARPGPPVGHRRAESRHRDEHTDALRQDTERAPREARERAFEEVPLNARKERERVFGRGLERDAGPVERRFRQVLRASR